MTFNLKSLTPKKVMINGILFASLLGATSAYALEPSSSATLNNTTKATGKNINVWDGSAFLSGKNTSSKYALLVAVKKSVTLLQDPYMTSRGVDTNASFTRSKVSLPEASSYYVEVSAIGKSTGSGQLDSD